MAESHGRVVSRAGPRSSGTEKRKRGAGVLGVVPEQAVGQGLSRGSAVAREEKRRKTTVGPERTHAPGLRQLQGWAANLGLLGKRRAGNVGRCQAAGF